MASTPRSKASQASKAGGANPVTGHVGAEGKVTLVEYADFECPYCREASGVVRRLRHKFGENLRFEFRHFPLTDVHPFAMKAAEAAEAAEAQGKFWEMHDLLFERQEALSTDDLVRYADELELDVRRFKQELHDGTYTARVEKDIRTGESEGVDHTPSFFIDGEIFDKQWGNDSLTQAIEERIRQGTMAA